MVVVLSACTDGAPSDAAASDAQTKRLCGALVTWREEGLDDITDVSTGQTFTDDDLAEEVAAANARAKEFYLSLSEFVPPSIQEDIELVAEGAFAEDDLRDTTDEVQEAAVRVGSYFDEHCGEELAPP